MRAMKIAIAVVAAIVVLLVAGVAIVAATFNPNDYKGLVTDAFTERTGRALAIDEDLRLAYFPWLAVETGGITIGSAPEFGGGAAPFAVVERAAARVKLLPLLSRRIEIGTVELDGFTLNLARDAELRGNWQDLVDAADGDAAAAPAEPPAVGEAPAPSFAIEGVRIRNGNVYWRENVSELRYSVTALELTTGTIDVGEPVELDAALEFRDETTGTTASLRASTVARLAAEGPIGAEDIDLAVVVAGNGNAPRELEVTAASVTFDRAAQTLTTTGLETQTAGIRAAWQVAARSVLDNPTIEGTVTVAPSPLTAVYGELGWSPPAGADDLGNFALGTSFSFVAEPRTIGVTGLEAEILGMRVRGSGSLAGDNELTGSVEIAEFTPNAAVQALLRAAVPPTVDVSALDRLALSTRFDSTLDTGRAALRGLRASVFGATLEAELEALPGERGNVFRGSVKTSRFAAESFAKAFAALLPPNLAADELGTIAIDTRFVFDTAADTVTVAPFTAELFGLRANGEVTGRAVSRAAAWTGTATVSEFSPQDLLRRFGLPPQPTSDPRALTRARVETRFDVDRERARLSGLTLTLDDSRITGDFTLEGFDAPAYRFALTIDSVDADRYLPPKARDAQAGEATAGDLELPQNNTMNLDGTMQIGALRLAGLQFADVGSRIVIGGGDARLENARARLYGGEFAGNFAVRAAGDSPGLALNGRASGLALQPLIEALTGEAANFSGTGNFDLDLAGRGRTIIENVGSAAGNVTFAMSDGTIKGFNLGRTLCAAYNATQGASSPPERPSETSYTVIQGTATVAGGTARSNDLLARTAFMDVAGAGTLGLVEQQLDYDFDAKLTGSIGIPGCETLDAFIGDALPFKIRGTVTEPAITPDFSKLVQRRVREEVRERIQDRLEDRLRDIFR